MFELRESRQVIIDYTNHKGVRRERCIQPVRVLFATHAPYHPELQWLLNAYDVDKRDWRTFAISNIHSWKPLP